MTNHALSGLFIGWISDFDILNIVTGEGSSNKTFGLIVTSDVSTVVKAVNHTRNETFELIPRSEGIADFLTSESYTIL